MATTQLHKISYPGLTPSDFGENLRKAFENIDSNFQKLASLGLTAGESGTPAVWVPYNLNSVFCKISADTFTSDYLNSTHREAIEKSFVEYNKITDHSREQYIEECRELYKQLIKSLPDDSIEVTSGSGESKKTWRHKWELISNNVYIFDKLSDQNYNETLKSYIGYTEDGIYYSGDYLNFLPGDILVAGNYDAETKTFTKLSTTAHIYIDPRFRNPMTIAGNVNTESISKVTDCSCVVYGGLDNGHFKFEYVYAFPRIHYKDGEFYLSANGIDTNIPLTGRPGKSGKSAQFAAVQIKDVEEYYNRINRIVYGSSDEVDKIFEIRNKIGSEDQISNPELLDGCPALIFPPAGYTANAYVTLYWVGYLTYDNDALTAYCGRENLVAVDLYEHSFGGMMMGLDMYEKSIARPAGNAPWTKPRGLMLPIGARYIGSQGQEYWDPTYNPTIPKPAHFGAHLIYSKKIDNETDASLKDLKKELHIGSIDDYRRIGATNDAAAVDYPSAMIGNKVSGTQLFIDEPVTITNYGSSASTEKILFTNMGSSDVKGNSTVGGNGTIGGYLSVTGNGTIGGDLIVGTDGNNNGIITANQFKRRNAGTGQILLANGNSTCGYKETGEIVTSSPIRIKNSDVGSQEVNFKFMTPQNEGDGSHYFLGDIKGLMPKPSFTHKVNSYHISPLGGFSYNNFQTNWSWPADVLSKYGENDGADIVSARSIPNQNKVHCIVDQLEFNGMAVVRLLISANSKSDTWDITDVSQNHYAFGIPMSQDDIAINWAPGVSLGDDFPKPKTDIVQRATGWGQYKNGNGDRTHHVMIGGLEVTLTKGGKFKFTANSTTAMFPEKSVPRNGEYVELTYIYKTESDNGSTQESSITYYWMVDTIPSKNDSIDSGGTTRPAWAKKYLISATKTYTGTTPVSPTTYLADGWVWSIEEKPTYTYYWASQNKPSSGTTIKPGPTETSATLWGGDVDKNKIWYLISVKSTKSDLADSGGAGLNYEYGGANLNAGIGEGDWKCEIKTPSNITYRWHQTKSEFNAAENINPEIEKYLVNTVLLYRDESTNSWKGNLAEMITNQTSEQYARYAGAHGVVCASHYKVGGDFVTEITIEAWSSDLRDILNITGRRLSLSSNNLTIQ